MDTRTATVRLAKAEDYSIIFGGVDAYFRQFSSIHYEDTLAADFVRIRNGFAPRTHTILVLENETKDVIGALAFTKTTVPEIQALYIHKNYRKQKYGILLTSAVAKYAKQFDAQFQFLERPARLKLGSVEESVQFWQKVGFEIKQVDPSFSPFRTSFSSRMECKNLEPLYEYYNEHLAFFDEDAKAFLNDVWSYKNQSIIEEALYEKYKISKISENNEKHVKLPASKEEGMNKHSLQKEKNTYIPRVLIAHQLDGVEAGMTITSNRKKLDNNNSALYGASVYANYISGENIGTPKNTDDKIVIGYTSEGLPFIIVVDGFYGCDSKAVFQFVDKYIVLLMDEYANELSKSEDPTETIKALIENIYKLYSHYSLASVEFSMSIAITYERDNQLYCAGFGIGDTGLVLLNSYGGIKQLAYSTAVNQFKDAFDQHSMKRIGVTRVINRNNVFNVPVNAGEEIFGYTYVFDELFLEGTEYVEEYHAANGELIIDKIVKRPITLTKLDKSGSLFNDVIKANNKIFESRCNSAKNDKKTSRFGDDCMMGFVIIPTADLQMKIKNKVSIPLTNEKSSFLSFFENKNNVDLFDETKKIEKDYYSTTSQRLYLKSKANPVADYFNLIEKLNDYDQSTLDEPGKKEILDKCIKIFDKLQNEDNYPKDIKTKALYQYAQGLIKQEPSFLYHLLNQDDKKRLNSNKFLQESTYLAKEYFKKAFDLGYIHAATRLGTVCYTLGEFNEAKSCLHFAINHGDEHATRMDERYQMEKAYQEAKIEKIENNHEESSYCLIM